MSNAGSRSRDMALVALFAALVAVGAFIRIPVPVVPFTLQFLFAESEQPDKLRSLGYKRILMYTNLLIHILQQKIAPEDSERIDGDWYPMGGTIADGYDPKNPCFTYSYYYDPRFLYRPASYSDRYEEPVHDVDPDSQD